MNGKIRVSIVATSLKGSTISPEPRPILNVVNGSNGRNNFSENLFSKSSVEQNIVNSIDGATALKLDENYEIKNSEEQNRVLIDSFESNEENQISENILNEKNNTDQVYSGISS